MEKTIEKVQEVGSSFLDTTKQIFEVVGNALKPGIEVALPIVKQAGEQALNITSPAISEASKKAQEAIQGSGFDTQPALTAAKVSSLYCSIAFWSTMQIISIVIADIYSTWAYQNTYRLELTFEIQVFAMSVVKK